MPAADRHLAERMSLVDTAWLRMDSEVNLMMIVGVWLLRPALTLAALRERVQSRLLRVPRFRQRVVQGVVGAQWQLAHDFDLARHLVTEKLQRQRGQTELAALQQRTSELASTVLDKAHPLWKFHLVERYRGGSALICRIHHCIADGVALNAVLLSLSDGSPPPPDAGLPAQAAPGAPTDLRHEDRYDEHGEQPQPDWVESLSDAVVQPLGQWAGTALDLAGRGLASAMPLLAHPRESAAGLLHGAWQATSDAAALAFMANDSPTLLKGEAGGRKIVSWCEPVPLDEVKAAGHALSASVNDVLVTCAAGALGHYLRQHGDDPIGKDIRAMVPVNLRPPGEVWDLGNRFGLAPLLVPVGIANPWERLGVVRARMSALKVGYQPVFSYALLGVGGVMIKPGQEALFRWFLDKSTAVITNVAGPTRPVRLCGSTLQQSIAWVPSSGDIGLGLSIVSYAGAVQFGLIADQALCPDPQLITERFAREFENLLALTLMLPWGADASPARAA